MPLEVRPLAGESIEWDAFVRSTPGGSPFHLLAWKRAVEQSFGHRPHYLMAVGDHGIEGVLPPAEFRAWFARFLPGIAAGEPKSLLTPAIVSDRRDPKIVHLDGLNLSRAWCMRSIAGALPRNDPARRILAESAGLHARDALAHVASGDYAGEHWLASFAVYMLSTPAP